MTPIITAARPMPPLCCRAPPRSVTGAVTAPGAGMLRSLLPNVRRRLGVVPLPAARRRHGLDDLGEADLLAGAGQRDDARQQRDPRRARQASRGGAAEHRAERV